MRRAILLLTLVGALVLACTGVVLAQQATPGGSQQQDRDRYIVVLEDDAGPPDQVANEHAQQHGAQVRHVYQSALNGYAATIPAQAVDAIQRDPRVKFINKDLPQEIFAKPSRQPDTTPPETTITAGPTEGSTVNSDQASFSFASSESGSTFQCSLDTASWSSCTSPKQYTGLANGSHTFQVKATDKAGNTDSTPASRTWTVDVPPPSSSAQPVPTGVDRIEGDATTNSTIAGNGSGTVNNVAVAVIDTGIDRTHPDLNALRGTNTISTDGNTDCTTRTNTGVNDGNGHGTHVSGTIGAKDDANGVVGVAPGVQLYAVKSLNNLGQGFTSDIICGIDWVTNNAQSLNIKVVNMSLGGSGSDDNKSCADTTDAYKKAICNSTTQAGVTYVVAAGNGGSDHLGDDFASTVPAAYRDKDATGNSKPLLLTVTALADGDGQPGGQGTAKITCRTGETDDTAATFSNYAITTVDQDHTIAAPGVCIKSTWPLTLGDQSGYNTISGTSMATPHVVGAVALCIAGNATSGASPNGPCAGLSPSGIIAKLRSDANTKTGSDTSANPYYGFAQDPTKDPTGNYFGYLAYVGSY